MATDSLPRCFLLIFNVLFWIGGLGCVAIGIWLLADPYPSSYFVVMKRSVTDDTLRAAVALLLTSGIICIFVGILGCMGTMKNSKRLLGGYVTFMFLIMILELVAGFIVLAFKNDIHYHMRQGMAEQIKEEYEWDNSVGKAWNFVQVRERCCGVDGSWDYRQSNWYYDQNPESEDENEVENWVPISCCVLDANQDRDVSRVDPQDPRPRDRKRCQEDAQGKKDGSQYLHGKGCYVAMVFSAWTHILVVIGLALAFGFIQLFGIIFACCLIVGDKRVQ